MIIASLSHVYPIHTDSPECVEVSVSFNNMHNGYDPF